MKKVSFLIELFFLFIFISFPKNIFAQTPTDVNVRSSCMDVFYIEDFDKVFRNDNKVSGALTKYANTPFSFETKAEIDKYNDCYSRTDNGATTTSCKDLSIMYPDPLDGKILGHVVKLVSRDTNVFEANQPIFLIRSFDQVTCVPGEAGCVQSDDWTPPFPGILQMYGTADGSGGKTCANESNRPANIPTDWCRQWYKSTTYYECANYYNKTSMCAGLIGSGSLPTSLTISTDGKPETGNFSDFRILDTNVTSLKLTNSADKVTLNHVTAATYANLNQQYRAWQLFNTGGSGGNTEAQTSALKLATFSDLSQLDVGDQSCVTIHWDPYGKILDAYTLEPVGNVELLLKNLNSGGALEKTVVANNPFFVNPTYTNSEGVYNFPVNEGEYFLFPSKANYSFPVESSVITEALQALTVVDPNEYYFKRSALYNNSQEKIIERAGIPERRDLLLQPKDKNYSGVTPKIISAGVIANKGVQAGNQVITGVTSHPRAVVRAYINNSVVAQTTSSLRGDFSLTIPASNIANNVTEVNLIAEKVPLTSRAKSQKSAAFKLELIPNQIGGFAYDQKTKVVPNAIVEIIIMDGIVYSSTLADADGYVTLSSNALPPMSYKIRLRDPKTGAILDLQNPSDFVTVNKPYFSATKNNVYAEEKLLLAKPSENIVSQIKKTPTFFSSSRSYDLTGGVKTTPASSSSGKLIGNNLLVVLLFFILLSLPVGFFIFLKISQKNRELL